ncbi:MAG: hypothetical protein ACYS8Z_06910 [Planctomycetota bacterium]|jgi:hypothetical protein
MIELTQNAQKSLDQYLHQARAYLKGAKSVDATEVEQNITEHIENELIGASEPVSAEDLETVLERLGSPQQWVPEEELPWWRKMMLRVQTGPEDWRLAYISFGLFALGILLLPAGVIMIAASFIAARAAVSVVEDATLLKAQKWLLYPSLITVYLGLFGSLLALPLLGLVALAYEWEDKWKNDFGILDDMHYWLAACTVFAASLGLWWLIQGFVLLARPNIPKVLFRPFADGFNRKWALVVICVGFAVLVGSLVVLYWVRGRYFTI